MPLTIITLCSFRQWTTSSRERSIQVSDYRTGCYCVRVNCNQHYPDDLHSTKNSDKEERLAYLIFTYKLLIIVPQ